MNSNARTMTRSAKLQKNREEELKKQPTKKLRKKPKLLVSRLQP